MKTKLLALLIILILPILAFTGVAGAQTFRSGDGAMVGSHEQVDSSVWLRGSSVNVAGKVNGDVFCVGSNVTITGEVNGDVLCAAQTITLSGTVTGNVRVAGETVIVGGDIKGSLSLAGQSVTIEDRAHVDRDAAIAGQRVNVHGQIVRDLAIKSNTATVDAAVGRNVNADLTTLTLADNAMIGGTLNYASPQEATINSGAHITGKTTFNQKEEQQNPAFDFANAFFWVIVALVSAVVFALIFPRMLYRTVAPAVKSPGYVGAAVLVGLLFGIVGPIVAIVLMITVFALPIGVLALVAWLLLTGLSGAFTAYYIGQLVWRNGTNVVGIMAAGAAIVAVILVIPYLNVIAWLFTIWFGSGVALMELKKHFSTPKYDVKSLK